VNRPPLGRLGALLAALLLGFAGIVVRLGFLQVRDARALGAMALEQRIRTIDLPARRGAILDRDGKRLALSLAAKDVYADPGYVRDPVRTAARIAPLLRVSRGRLLKELTADTSFVYLGRQVDARVASRIARLELPGIGFLADAKRYYPSGPIAPQVLGFVGVDGAGLAGLELEYQDNLRGRSGNRTVEIDPSGHFIPQGVNRDLPPVPGSDLVTTIDRDIQYRVQLELRRAVTRNRARSGTVIVMDPHSGDILAMATYPWFDPNRFSSSPERLLRNPAIVDVYEPGSVNKVITASAALQAGAWSTTKRLVVPDHWRIGPDVFHDAERHPREVMTLADIMARSSNVGTIRVADALGSERLAQYLARFGLGQPTGIRFPGESGGIVAPLFRWTSASMGTIPVGQGLAVTPLQMTAVYAAVANGGVWVQPRLVIGQMAPDGTFRPAPRPDRRRVVSTKTARTVGQILAYAVDVGTGANAQIPGYWVAGKTGTAQIPKANGRGYTDKYDASFIGFTPAARPQLVVACILDRPVTQYGSVAAAPLFRNVARYALARLRVAPTERPSLPPHVITRP
jgi:cell division protein FtsI (penicillin-binding protein 3)